MDFTKMSTSEFVAKIHESQAKNLRSRKHQGYGHPEKRLPSKQGIW
ncbi:MULTISPECIES: DUF4023 domain-containing protein [Brevibacillus]|jgi:hypothetical protein|uniref:DUF4023 domain-containing protein n=1 Tax=Brevibacillus gelatini TaxID=1655277 RepID=A0A3M8AUQ9_9BACL|nr:MULTISPECIES: DUF4023 domain-containing protein [Brevibacillus]TGV17867.1 DUF4023 domain-containing protein [Mesorhizobium sp. M00.F.Ca.ET.186.01.1.1]MBU8715931.1 DUF4023 domain-containing protein [Brevibacillus parabrevis]MDH6352465.1 hypothetical protein [Brevibacillus sp. 1238]MDR4998008.1 DUF4023 domain-containing protein [Brevibacillus parabrevis]MED1725420.1 DUF4023 domain-containing protein [Brevibacillus parabrevis]